MVIGVLEVAWWCSLPPLPLLPVSQVIGTFELRVRSLFPRRRAVGFVHVLFILVEQGHSGSALIFTERIEISYYLQLIKIHTNSVVCTHSVIKHYKSRVLYNFCLGIFKC